MLGIGKRKDLHVTGLLSAYLDNQLNAKERSRVEAHLRDCVTCSEDLRSLQATVRALQAMPRVAVPRSFVLQPTVELRPSSRPLQVILQLATAATALALVISLGSDVFLGGRQAAAPPRDTMLSAAAAPTPTEEALSLKAARGEVATQPTAPTAGQQERAVAAAAAPQPTPPPAPAMTAPTSDAQRAITTAGQTPLAAAPLVPTAPKIAGAQVAPTATTTLPPTATVAPTATMTPSPTPQPPTPTPAMQMPVGVPSPTAAPVPLSAQGRLSLRPLQFGLAGLLVVLIVATVAVRRRGV